MTFYEKAPNRPVWHHNVLFKNLARAEEFESPFSTPITITKVEFSLGYAPVFIYLNPKIPQVKL